jgi:mannose-1-phosphate guanylyltransferase
MQRTCPEVLAAARRAFAARASGDHTTFKESFSSSPSISIDVAVMEKARRVLTIPSACGWSDLGSWEAVFEFRGGRPSADVIEGDGASEGGSGNLVLAGARPVRVVGLSGVAVVDSPDGLLVMKLGASDDLRRAVEKGLK